MCKHLFVRLLPLAAATAILGACAGMPSVPGVTVGLNAPNLTGGGTLPSSATGVDFKNDEVLCLGDNQDPKTGNYYLGRVLTPASQATKNQAEVLFVETGKKAWSSKVVTSRKANKDELQVGTLVFYPEGWGNHEAMSQDNYRYATWGPGNVTNNDELFKGIVEVNGEKYYLKYIRIPTSSLE